MKRLTPRINIPNTLTLIRILLTPVFAICLIRHLFDGALFVFVVAAITDGLDGLVARLFKRKTTLGAYLDPAADKLLLITAFVTLAIQRMIPGWLSVIVITRDILIILGVALLNIMDRSIEIKPSVLSKITTVAQLTTVCSVLVAHQVNTIAQIEWFLFWSTASVTTASGFHYIYRGLNILQENNLNGEMK